MTLSLLNLRLHSLLRGGALVLGGLALAIPISHYPRLDREPLLIVPLLMAIVGTVETMRCVQRRWSFYHAGVMLFLTMDLMTLTLMMFFWLYPYFY